MKVAVLGASGFVGTAVMRQLGRGGEHQPQAFARSTGASWELTRQGIPVSLLNVADRAATVAALKGFDAVVNCMRGGGDDMLSGLRNTLIAAREGGVKRVIHLSSISIYGDFPDPASRAETAPPKPSNGYGDLKLAQDSIVEEFTGKGVETLILCPPNITGPASGFMTDIVRALDARRLLQVRGDWVCAMVDVDNLAHAIRCGVESRVTGKRFFVTDNDSISWSRLIEEMLKLTNGAPPPQLVDADDLRAVSKPVAERKPSFGGAAKRMLSPEIRSALAQEPLFRNLFKTIKTGVMKLPVPILDRVASVASPPMSVPKRSSFGDMDVRLSAQQLRGVDHSPEAAMREIGYRPLYTTAESLERFAAWYHFMWPATHREGRAGTAIGGKTYA